MSASDWIGGAISAIILGGALVVWFGYDTATLKPNEVAEFWAGVVSAVALVWLVIGYYAQREELGLQRRELSENTQTQREQVRAMTRQAQALNKSARALSEHTRPYVTADVAMDGYDIVVRVRNDGIRSAINVQVVFSPPVRDLLRDPLDFSAVLSHGILAPGAERKEVAGFGASELSAVEGEALYLQTTASIEYEDEDGRRYEHSYAVTLRQAGKSMAQKRTVRSSLDALAQTIGTRGHGSTGTVRQCLETIAKSVSGK